MGCISIHALREEGDIINDGRYATLDAFLSTPSARRATRQLRWSKSTSTNFYPRPPRGGRLFPRSVQQNFCDFYPRPPRGGRPTIFGSFWSASGFLSTPSARRATAIGAAVIAKVVQISIHALREEGDRGMSKRKYLDAISIHALREEGDPDAHSPWQAVCGISIHALREEGDSTLRLPSRKRVVFLSTPSARRATKTFSRGLCHVRYFYPRPPRGGRPRAVPAMTTPANFYPRPPRGGRPFSLGILPPVSIFLSTPSARRATPAHALCDPADHLFLSTPSARRATAAYRAVFRCRSISIHALREEGDGSGFSVVEVLCLFLSTPSARRATPSRASRWPSSTTFLSTPSARRATTINVLTKRRCIISIHALREEGDKCSPLSMVFRCDFYPRPPRGGRLLCVSCDTHTNEFLSTPSARRATDYGHLQDFVLFDFYPRPPRGGRLVRQFL